MRFSVRRHARDEHVPARLVPKADGTEIRGDHLLGIVNSAGQLVVKLRDEYLVVDEESEREEEERGA